MDLRSIRAGTKCEDALQALRQGSNQPGRYWIPSRLIGELRPLLDDPITTDQSRALQMLGFREINRIDFEEWIQDQSLSLDTFLSQREEERTEQERQNDERLERDKRERAITLQEFANMVVEPLYQISGEKVLSVLFNAWNRGQIPRGARLPGGGWGDYVLDTFRDDFTKCLIPGLRRVLPRYSFLDSSNLDQLSDRFDEVWGTIPPEERRGVVMSLWRDHLLPTVGPHYKAWEGTEYTNVEGQINLFEFLARKNVPQGESWRYSWLGELRQIPPPLRPSAQKRQYLPFIPVPPRFPGRIDLPVSGPPSFANAINTILVELMIKAPGRYKEVVEFLPQAKYDPAELERQNGPGWAANAAGIFAVNGSNIDSFFYTVLHETGHNVAGHLQKPGANLPKTTKEAQAHAYAEAVLRELGRKTHYPDGYNYTRYEDQLPTPLQSTFSRDEINHRVDWIVDHLREEMVRSSGSGILNVAPQAVSVRPQGFARDNVIGCLWHKSNDWGQRFTVRFHADGTLTECSADDASDCWGGEWYLTEQTPYLVTRIGPYEVLYMQRGDAGGIGVETSSDDPERRIFFSLRRA